MKTHQDPEELYIDLLLKATNKYARWDPEDPVEVGDWGTMTSKGTFHKEGNIYEDGKAERYGIPKAREHGVNATESIGYYSSHGVKSCDFDREVGGYVPVTLCRHNAT